MKAILFHPPGTAKDLYIGESKTPTPGPQQVLVKVKATALNRADLLQRRGLYPPPPGASEILGLEMAGEVVAKGPETEGIKIGDRVFALLSGGGYAEYVSVNHQLLMPLPEALSWEAGAAIAEAFLTAWQATAWLAKLQSGENILIHAGASGVGSAAIQLARKAGAKIAVTASAGKHDFCKSLGAQICIDYQKEDFGQIVKNHFRSGADVIIDFIGAPYFNKNIEVLATDGRMVQLGFLGGSKTADFDLMPLLRKRLKIMGSTLRSRSLDYKIRLTQDFSQNCLADFSSGLLKPVIDSVFDWTEVTAAHQRMEQNANQGKIILRVGR